MFSVDSCSFLPVTPSTSHSVIQEKVQISYSQFLLQMQYSSSLPEGLLPALALFPIWVSLWPLFPSSLSVQHVALSPVFLVSFSGLSEFFELHMETSQLFAGFIQHSVFPLLGSLKLFVPEYFLYWALSPFCLIPKLTLPIPCWLILYFSQFLFLLCGALLLKIL